MELSPGIWHLQDKNTLKNHWCCDVCVLLFKHFFFLNIYILPMWQDFFHCVQDERIFCGTGRFIEAALVFAESARGVCEPESAEDLFHRSSDGQLQTPPQQPYPSLNLSSSIHSQQAPSTEIQDIKLPQFTEAGNLSGSSRADPAFKSKILLCEYCDASFTSTGGLSLHKTSVHFQRKFECSICGKVVKRKATLLSHMQTHTSPRGVLCRTCHIHFTPRDLLTHTCASRREDSSSS